MSNKTFLVFVLLAALCFLGCAKAETTDLPKPMPVESAAVSKIANPGKVIHVLVALCDNENQGIVPVPAHLGNGEDPQRNLYWGAAYGVKTYFSKSRNWEKLGELANPKDDVLERVVFKHRTENVYLIADAYRGSKMKETINDFFAAASGNERENIDIGGIAIQGLATADLIAFVGHNGLMDFRLDRSPKKQGDETRDAVILACASRNYFSKHLRETGANPLLWTTNLMAPEAYILHDAIEGWVKNETASQIRVRAASAYSKYQRVSQKSAENLLVTGW